MFQHLLDVLPLVQRSDVLPLSELLKVKVGPLSAGFCDGSSGSSARFRDCSSLAAPLRGCSRLAGWWHEDEEPIKARGREGAGAGARGTRSCRSKLQRPQGCSSPRFPRLQSRSPLPCRGSRAHCSHSAHPERDAGDRGTLPGADAAPAKEGRQHPPHLRAALHRGRQRPHGRRRGRGVCGVCALQRRAQRGTWPRTRRPFFRTRASRLGRRPLTPLLASRVVFCGSHARPAAMWCWCTSRRRAVRPRTRT